jgi:cytochrome c551/c552
MKISFLIITTLSLTLLLSCGNGNETQQNSSQPSNESGLSDFELDHGIGPVTERLELGEINPELAEEGRSIFAMKCEACHNMEGRMVGPALGDVLERRSAEFVMNMILNPSGMTREHPEGQRMLQEYMTPMPFQNVSDSDARAIVEYLRDYSNNE